MALAAKRSRTGKRGHARPRIAPPRPARSDIATFRGVAASCGIELMPWQDTAATYIEARGRGNSYHWPEVAVVVGRQNGKTELLVPHIVNRILAGRRVMHTAQNRMLPREVFGRVADIMMNNYRDQLKTKPRHANGQETIALKNGGHYRIAAPTRGGARGPSNDDVIIDEVRELDTYDFIAAAEPTLAQSVNPQILYLSNAGEDDSVVLNSIRQRADSDPSLAYLEWSAAPERETSDRDGWLEANPAVGQLPGHDMMAYLERKYTSYTLAGTASIFETEHLCRWVSSSRERLVDEYAFAACAGPVGSQARQTYMAVSMTPDGKRASAALAWKRPDGTIALRLLYDVTGDPIDLARLGEDLRADANKLGVKVTGYDPVTDAALAKYVLKPEKVGGQAFANASSQFVNLVNARRLRWQDDGTLPHEMAMVARKSHDDTGHFQAVRMADDRPIPAALAAIRAVWLASGPVASSPRVY